MLDGYLLSRIPAGSAESALKNVVEDHSGGVLLSHAFVPKFGKQANIDLAQASAQITTHASSACWYSLKAFDNKNSI